MDDIKAKMKNLDDLASRQKMYGDLVGCVATRQSLEILHDEHDVDMRSRTQNLGQIANISVHLGALEEAERAARKSYSLRDGLEGEEKATCVFLLSCVLAESRKFEEAIEFFDQAFAMFEQVFPSDDSFLEILRNYLKRMRAKDMSPYLDL